ncbi:MetQ/NlpA family ABC transporter substrate-binding protein [Ligilactobacillus sp. LYQ60]|uniref:MetQ/NlpA family ABC transporter substrate-binding protein n=1 Tax=unclassified Ligilactobacillus TaxID=2767920 RepID=UPI0038526BE9
MRKKNYTGLFVVIGIIVLLIGGALWGVHQHQQASKTVTVGIVGNDKGTQEIWKQVAKTAKKRYGITVKTKTFTEYTQPNKALAAGETDLNAFQHYVFLDQWNKKNGNQVVAIGKTYIAPIRLYSNKYHRLSALPDGATIAIPNDAANESRALYVLKNAGLITLKKSAGKLVTIADIAQNPKHLQIKELADDQTAHALSDVDAAVVNNDYAIPAKLGKRQTIYVEPVNRDSEQWINVIAAKRGQQHKRIYQDVVKAYQTPAVQRIYRHYYGKTELPAWNLNLK